MKDYLNIVNDKYPVRRSDLQKKEFQDYVLEELKDTNYNISVKKALKQHNNIIIGNVEKAKVVFTAHYDTPARSLFPNLVIPRKPALTMLYHFTFPIIIAIVAVLLGYGIGAIIGASDIVNIILYLDIYFLLFLLCMLAFTNEHNKNDNTSGVACVLELAKKYERDDIAFILFDNEEKGLLGSKGFNKENKKLMINKLVINMDCVGLGNNVLFISKKDAMIHNLYSVLKDEFNSNDKFNVNFYPVKGSMGNSDYKSFKCGIGMMVCEEKKGIGYFTSRIHTDKDTLADSENIEFIVNGLSNFIEKI